MGDKSPKAKQRGKEQKDAAKATAKNSLAKRQASFSGGSAPAKEKKK